VGFVCSVCGEFHPERMLDIRAGLPDAIHELNEAERGRRAWISDDFAVLDETHFYVRGLLEIPIPELESRFGYGVWLEVEQHDFAELLEHWTDPEQSEFAPTPGLIANELEPYIATNGLRALLQPVSADLLPLVEVLDSAHPLALDQRHGISGPESDRLAAAVLHE
jgi:hypothetical protein